MKLRWEKVIRVINQDGEPLEVEQEPVLQFQSEKNGLWYDIPIKITRVQEFEI